MALIKPVGYEPLTTESAINLAIQLKFFPEGSTLSAVEIGDGNLNLVFRISDLSIDKSIIIKQALPYAKVVGESWPLTLHRATIESNALKVFSQFSKDRVPDVYYSDEIFAITVMEDLSDYKILRTGLIEGHSYEEVPKHIGTFIANTLFHTSDFALSPEDKKERVRQFLNPELCKITEDLVFTDPFFDYDTNNFEGELTKDVQAIWKDTLLKLEVARLKKKFLTQSDALIHGDLHTGSIFVTEQDTKVIDPEFAFYGPFGFDLGQFFANLLLNALARPQAEQHLLGQIVETWDVFTNEFKKLWYAHSQEPFTQIEGYVDSVLAEILEDSLGFAGCEIIRRTIGLAHVADLDGIQDDTLRIQVKRQALSLGKRLILQRQKITNLKQITLT